MSAIQNDSVVPSSGVSSSDSVSISTSQQLASIAGRSVRVAKKQALFFYFVVSLHYFFATWACGGRASREKKPNEGFANRIAIPLRKATVEHGACARVISLFFTTPCS